MIPLRALTTDVDEARLHHPFLRVDAVERLCIDLIAAEQERLLRHGRMSRRHMIAAAMDRHGSAQRGTIEIGEDVLGIDSLMLLDLVGVVNRYFCLSDTGAEDLLLIHRTVGEWARIVLAHFERVGVQAGVGFETSGSTGSPKRIVHSRLDLEDEVKECLDAVLTPVPAGGRILACVPPRHIYGFLWGVLLAERAGAETVELHRSAGDALLRMAQPGDIVIGTPFTWERAAQAGRRLPAGVTGVTSAGPSTEATWAAAADLGVERLVEVYGSTETGGLGWREAWGVPFRLSGRFHREGGGLRWRSSGREVPLQDQLAWRDGSHFTVQGRLDTVVQVAGTNVSMEDVVRVLRAVAGVSDAIVRLDGERLAALVVPDLPDAPTEDLEDALRAAANRHLCAAARPDRYTFARQIPRTDMGKVARW